MSITKEEEERLQEIHKIYIFRKWDSEWNRHRKVFDFFEEGGSIKPDESVKQEGFVLHKLFEPNDPEKPYAAENYAKKAVHKYFKELLDLGNGYNGQVIRLWYNKIIAEKQIFLEITELIKGAKLEANQDLILYLIARIQDYFDHHIADYTTPEKRARINGIQKQADELGRVIDWYTDKTWQKEDTPPKPRPTGVTFTYPAKGENARITDPSLVRSILEGTMNELEHTPYFDWKLALKKKVSSVKEDESKFDFKERVAIAFHRFLTEEQIFKLSEGKATSDQELLFIGRLLPYTLVHEWPESKLPEEIIKNVRTWVTQNRVELEQVPDSFEIMPENFDGLLRFFPPEFLNLGPVEKDFSVLQSAALIIERFDLFQYGREIAHLLACYRALKDVLESDFRLFSGGIIRLPKVQAFFEFLNCGSKTVKTGKITNIKFQKEGHSEPLEISDPAPLEIIQRALQEYYRTHPEDLSCDVFETERTPNEYGLFNIEPKDLFKQSNQRFYPWFCKHFYLYLKARFPKEGYEPEIASQYKTIIAATILQFQHHQFVMKEQEHEMYFKVEQWLKDSGLEVPILGIRAW
jgi:hypothetical protein